MKKRRVFYMLCTPINRSDIVVKPCALIALRQVAQHAGEPAAPIRNPRRIRFYMPVDMGAERRRRRLSRLPIKPV